MKHLCLALLVAVAATTTGCNYLGLDQVSAGRGQVVVVTGTLSLDSAVTAMGVMAHIDVAPPLTMLGCVTANANTMLSQAASVTSQKSQLVAIANDPWTDVATVFTCQIYVPTTATVGYYAITLSYAGLSDPAGRKLGVTTYNGAVHVTA